MKRFKYTASHLDFLRTGYRSMNARDLTKIFNTHFGLKKTEGQIKSAFKNHKIVCGRAPKDRLINRYRLFNDKQIEFLRNNYRGRSIADMTTLFNAEFDTEMTEGQIKTAVNRRHIISGRTGYFPKGHKSWNKGTKGLTAANKMSFKKGSIPASRRPVGSERICSKDGYILIKVKERNPYTGYPTRWKHKHIHIWEKLNGPVPDGFVVMLKDGNQLNVCPENLMLVSRAELLRLNKYGYKDAPAQIKPSILAMVKLEIKIFYVDKKK